MRQVRYEDGYHFVIRESYRQGGHWTHRDLLDLGKHPEDYIEYPGGNGFYFHGDVEDALDDQGVDYTSDDLEELFMPFLDPEIRRIVENFRHGQAAERPWWKKCSGEELLKHQNKLHSVDKRRLHFLRCGRVDIGDLEGRPWKFLNVLLEKSRDEIEHTIEVMERELRPHEMRPYIYTAFHLQSYFPNHPMRNRPMALDAEKVDECFLEEICRVNRDPLFFKGISEHDSRCLHPLLVKYVILYFDSAFQVHRPSWMDYFEQFAWHRQFRRPGSSKPSMAVEEACGHLGIESGRFQEMEIEDVTRCYRKLAKSMHPDVGGDHEAFVKLTDAYECLLLMKR
jgi:hypothetical protein